MKHIAVASLSVGLLLSAVSVSHATDIDPAAPVSALEPFFYLGGAALYNDPKNIHTTKLFGGVLKGGVVWDKQHSFSVQAGFLSGEYTTKSLVPSATGNSDLPFMDPDHACCGEPVVAPVDYDYEYHFKHETVVVPVFFSYNFLGYFDAQEIFSFRVGPTAGLLFISNEVNISEQSEGVHFRRKLSKTTFTYGGGVEASLGWRVDEHWSLEAGYRFFVSPSYSIVDGWKSGLNLNHQFGITLTRRF